MLKPCIVYLGIMFGQSLRLLLDEANFSENNHRRSNFRRRTKKIENLLTWGHTRGRGDWVLGAWK